MYHLKIRVILAQTKGGTVMSAKQQSILANLGLLLAAAIWGGGFLAGKFALAEYEPFTILAFRFLGSALCLGLIFCRSLRHTAKNVAKKGMLLGILQFVGLSVQLAGLDRTTPGKQSFLIASYVMFVPFLSCFLLRKRINGRELLAAILTLAGIGCISLNESLTIGLGEGLSVGFAFLFALQIVLVSIFARNEDPIRLSFFQFLSAGLLASVTALLTDGIPQSCSLLTLGSLLYLIVPNTVLAFTIQNVAQRYTSETATAILLSLESMFGFLFSVWFLKEPVTAKVVLGCILIFAAVLLSKIDAAQFLKRHNIWIPTPKQP